MKCPECTPLAVLLLEPRSQFKDYPEWYRLGQQCPRCGAGYVGEFGTIDIEDKSNG